MNLAQMGADCEVALATGEAGTVYLCHPFLVHAAQIHRGKRPRFMAQPASRIGSRVTMVRTRRSRSRSGRRSA